MELGKWQTLVAKRLTENGMYFVDKENTEVLLPKNEVENELSIGDIKNLFIYKDSQDRIIATLREPYIKMGELKRLRVVQVTKIGAFLDWGLQKDLFLPFKEQTALVVKNREYLVALYEDKSHRLCATMKIFKYLKDKNYKLSQMVMASVYQIVDNGALVAIDDMYHGFIPKQELVGKIEIGDYIKVRVIYKREDGKYNVSMRKPLLQKQRDDARELLRLMNEWDGELLVNEKDSPEKIKRLCNMSKAEFKRAIGLLLKEKKIKIENNVILKFTK